MPRTLLLILLLFAAALPAAALVNVAGPACGTTVHADSQFSEAYGGDKVADGSMERGSGCWYSRDQTTLPCALTFKLAGVTDLRAVVLHQALWGGNMYHTRGFAVEVSADDGSGFPGVGDPSSSATRAAARRAPTSAASAIASARATADRPTPVVGEEGTRT